MEDFKAEGFHAKVDGTPIFYNPNDQVYADGNQNGSADISIVFYDLSLTDWYIDYELLSYESTRTSTNLGGASQIRSRLTLDSITYVLMPEPPLMLLFVSALLVMTGMNLRKT